MPPPRGPTRISPTTVVVARGGPLVITPRDAPIVVSPPRGPSAPADPKARALALIAEVHAIKHAMSASAYPLGVVLKALGDPELIAALGCKTFEEVLAAHDLPSRMTAIKYVALAEHFEESEATALGAEKGYALVRYGRALEQPPTALLARNAKLAGVLLRDASAADILRAARDLAEKQRQGAATEDDTADGANKAVRRLGSKLRKSGAPGAKLRRVRRGGAWRVVIELDPDEAAALAAHL